MNPTPLASGGLQAGAIVATAASLWMLLPNGRDLAVTRRLGILLGVGAMVAFIAAGRRLGGLGEEAVFLLVSLVAVVSAAATIVSRSPVYAAIWFALTLAGVAGVLLVLESDDAAPRALGAALLLEVAIGPPGAAPTVPTETP